MGSVNKVILVGNLGRDVELRYTPGGAAVATLNLATTETWKDKEGQKKLFKATGAPPPNTQFWPKIAAQDPFMKLLKEAVLDSPDKVRGAYYFPQWPAVHKAFNDAVTKAVTGKREDIAKVLAEGAPLVSKAATP